MSWFRREPETPDFTRHNMREIQEPEEKEITIYGDGYGEVTFRYTRFTVDADCIRIFDEEGESAVFFTRNIAGYSLA